ncbi:hypothetical protein [Thermogemmatispora carboxidivorans]|uniref:hypothetical protein n=1 Tax=Thermogemmatispora carboxidivorans TaxID=1382306 RepID=UPI0012DE7283|nr:hypothetical protein [Thermogemmatispora carboxidivorans]
MAEDVDISFHGPDEDGCITCQVIGVDALEVAQYMAGDLAEAVQERRAPVEDSLSEIYQTEKGYAFDCYGYHLKDLMKYARLAASEFYSPPQLSRVFVRNVMKSPLTWADTDEYSLCYIPPGQKETGAQIFSALEEQTRQTRIIFGKGGWAMIQCWSPAFSSDSLNEWTNQFLKSVQGRHRKGQEAPLYATGEVYSPTRCLSVIQHAKAVEINCAPELIRRLERLAEAGRLEPLGLLAENMVRVAGEPSLLFTQVERGRCDIQVIADELEGALGVKGAFRTSPGRSDRPGSFEGDIAHLADLISGQRKGTFSAFSPPDGAPVLVVDPALARDIKDIRDTFHRLGVDFERSRDGVLTSGKEEQPGLAYELYRFASQQARRGRERQ